MKLDDLFGRAGGSITEFRGKNKNCNVFSRKTMNRWEVTEENKIIKWVPIPPSYTELETSERTNQLRRYPFTPSRETEILQKIEHKNIVKFIKLIQNSNINANGIVLEYLKMGALNDIPNEKVLSDTEISEYFKDILNGVQYLHSVKIIHRDLNPSNMLITEDNHLKITDFSISVEFTGEDALLRGTIGTPEYLAPECVNASGDVYTGKPVDVWAMGMTLYWMIYRRPFYNGADKYEVYEAISTQPVIIDDKVSDQYIRRIFEGIFKINPKERNDISRLQILIENV
uniref:Protein kinase domain-containing protein n=1 Tax=Trichobilharzia regenti TaxID=157069 RepID=A0AA85ILD5_TRIRE|nr:unnamed protein product [Trichobilharzia regenti]